MAKVTKDEARVRQMMKRHEAARQLLRLVARGWVVNGGPDPLDGVDDTLLSVLAIKLQGETTRILLPRSIKHSAREFRKQIERVKRDEAERAAVASD